MGNGEIDIRGDLIEGCPTEFSYFLSFLDRLRRMDIMFRRTPGGSRCIDTTKHMERELHFCARKLSVGQWEAKDALPVRIPLGTGGWSFAEWRDFFDAVSGSGDVGLYGQYADFNLYPGGCSLWEKGFTVFIEPWASPWPRGHSSGPFGEALDWVVEHLSRFPRSLVNMHAAHMVLIVHSWNELKFKEWVKNIRSNSPYGCLPHFRLVRWTDDGWLETEVEWNVSTPM